MADWSGLRLHRVDDLVVAKHAPIPMPDGATLAADLYATADVLEDGAAPRPVVLDYIPYRKDEVEIGGWGAWYYGQLARAGYVVARVDIRGTGSSTGVAEDEYSADELADGCVVIDWLGTRDWCDGNVCMTGISYGGFTSLLLAGRNPPHLTAIAPMFFGEDRYANGDHFRGGLLGLWFDLGYYGTYLAAFNHLPPDPLEEGWEERWVERLEANEPYMLLWLRNQVDGAFWRGGSIIDVVDEIRCPALLIGGFRDAYPSGPFRVYPRLCGPRRLLVGPWNHAVPDIAIPGPRVDYVREIVAWFDRWCGRGAAAADDDGAPLTVFMQRWQDPDPRRVEAVGDWRGEADWPPAGAIARRLHPRADGVLGAGPDRGVDLVRHEPAAGSTSGLFCYMSFGQSGDQRLDEALSRTYTTSPLEEAVSVLGEPLARLRVRSPVDVLALVVSLSAVAPDGRSLLVTRGVLNATRRDGLGEPRALRPGEWVDLDVRLDATGFVFEPGSRMRLSLTTSDWPNLWPTPQAGTAELDLAGTWLDVPVVPEGSPLAPQPLAAAPERDMRPATVPRRWTVTRDLATGVSRFEVGFGRRYTGDAGTRTIDRAFSLTAEVDPADPGSAWARGRHRSRISGDGFDVESQATSTMRSVGDHFDVVIEVEVARDGRPFWSRTWTEHVPRRLL